MSYHKPELFALSLAASSVGSQDVGSGEAKDSTVKLAGLHEAGRTDIFGSNPEGRDLGAASSTTAAAYEAEE